MKTDWFVFATSTNSGDEVCLAKIDNNVPCVCASDASLVFSSIEFGAFFACILIFFLVQLRKKLKVDCRQVFVVSLFAIAFLFHYGFVLYTFLGPNNCRKIRRMTSYICFLPQAIFFIVFIWVIFKLLVIWRLMVSNTQD